MSLSSLPNSIPHGEKCTLLSIPGEPMKEYISPCEGIYIPLSCKFLLVEYKIREFFFLESESVILITIGI